MASPGKCTPSRQPAWRALRGGHSPSTGGRRAATSRGRPGVDSPRTPLFTGLHSKSGRGTRMAKGGLSATIESLADATAMRTKANIKWSGEPSVASHGTDHSHRPEEIILSPSLSGEGNACLPPSENFTLFKSKTGRWRSTGAAKLRESQATLPWVQSHGQAWPVKNTALIFKSFRELPLDDVFREEGHRSEPERSGQPLGDQGGTRLPLASNPALHRFSGPGRWQLNRPWHPCSGAE